VAPAPGWRGLLLGHPLELNTATAADLEALPGIGPRTASAVLADRDARGPYATVEELMRVRGIGPGTLRRLRPLLRVSPAPGAPAQAGGAR
jgi:competence protein ComEA